jgi:hypothetical protein
MFIKYLSIFTSHAQKSLVCLQALSSNHSCWFLVVYGLHFVCQVELKMMPGRSYTDPALQASHFDSTLDVTAIRPPTALQI